MWPRYLFQDYHYCWSANILNTIIALSPSMTPVSKRNHDNLGYISAYIIVTCGQIFATYIQCILGRNQLIFLTTGLVIK